MLIYFKIIFDCFNSFPLITNIYRDEGCKVMCPSPGGMKSCCVENSCCRNRVKKSTYDNPVIDIKTQVNNQYCIF